MKDLSREEKIRNRISELKEVCEKRKWRRIKQTFFVLCGVILLFVFMYGEISDTKNLVYLIIGVPLMAVLIMVISMFVLLYIIAGAINDEKAIARLEGELKNEKD